MTQGIRDFFALPNMDEVLKTEGPVMPEPEIEDDGEMMDPGLVQTVALAQQAQARLDMVEGKDHAEAMDTIYKETLKHAQEIMDLGFNVDLPRARGLFEVAGQIYGRAIEAKNSKRDSQLKAMKLALDQRKLDLDERKLNAQLGETEKNTLTGDATVVREDRNELIRRLREERDQTRAK